MAETKGHKIRTDQIEWDFIEAAMNAILLHSSISALVTFVESFFHEADVSGVLIENTTRHRLREIAMQVMYAHCTDKGAERVIYVPDE